jgi:hypothetical protein
MRSAAARATSAGLALATAIGLLVASATAPHAIEPTLGHLALSWLLGDWTEPIVCEISGSPTRALRRVMVSPVPTPTGDAPTARVQFPDPDAPGATRCFSDLGGDVPRIEGSLVLGYEGRARPDTAQRDFQTEMRHHGGFDFRIRSGRLRLTGWATDAPAREIDFEGGTAEAREVRAGTDAARLVDELGAPRGVELTLLAPAGERLLLHLVQRAGR